MSSRQILVVDETPLLKSLIGGLLGAQGDVNLASSASDALSLVRQHAYDLLLINCQTGGLDSVEVLRQLREADCRTEAVAVAGWLTPRIVEWGDRLDVKRIFRLPAEIGDFTCHLKFS